MPFLLTAQINADTFEEQVDEGINIFVRNDEYSPVTFEFKLSLTGMTATPAAAKRIVVPARTERFLAYEIRVKSTAREYGFGYEYTINIGDHSRTDYDRDFVYELPVAPGRDVQVSQGYNGRFSHKNALALDFNLPLGAPIHAARGGVVTDVVDHNDKGCPSSSCEPFENRVVVLHDDGTFAGYAHLQQNSAAVAIGETIVQGQLLGRAGATGFANGPHLHFSVYRQLMDRRAYVPTEFRIQQAGTQVQGKLEEQGRYKRPVE